MHYSRITIFAGYNGSGKTNLAVNYALWLQSRGLTVAVCDLDTVNPYFRTADFAALFKQHNIQLIASEYANSNVEIPSIPSEAQALFNNECYGIIDLGGDDRGALALGRYAKKLSNNYEMLLVVNKYRSLSQSIQDIMEIRSGIEKASGVRFTALVNNPNLGAETTAEHIRSSIPFIEALSKETGLPVKMTAAEKKLAVTINENIFPIEIYSKLQWK
jgi:MinD-like ATPase involved in chromosome partitioning or flagellar assembly